MATPMHIKPGARVLNFGDLPDVRTEDTLPRFLDEAKLDLHTADIDLSMFISYSSTDV